VLAALGLHDVCEGDVEERRTALVTDEQDVAALPSVTSGRAAVRHIFLAAERHAAVTSGTSGDRHLAGVDELHGAERKGNKKIGRSRRIRLKSGFLMHEP
jgi:hypothetical protein